MRPTRPAACPAGVVATGEGEAERRRGCTRGGQQGDVAGQGLRKEAGQGCRPARMVRGGGIGSILGRVRGMGRGVGWAVWLFWTKTKNELLIVWFIV